MTHRTDPANEAEETLDFERWWQIDSLFAATLERSPDERPGYLDGECAGDPELRRIIEKLLDHDSRVDGFLDSPAFLLATSDEDRGPASGSAVAGDAVGPYRIEREIARGGMGSVYLAYR
ncbi:MAG: hypothetical protein GY944_25210, partial [bacterium]|nr:hypothetical protein [bacterium]